MTGVRPQRHRPRTHWVLLSVLMVLFLIALLVSGIVDGNVGEGADTPRLAVEGGVPDCVPGWRTRCRPAPPQQAGFSVPDRHVVFTFDDGPTAWTDQILDLLRARQARATFFVVGARVAERPDLVRRMYAEGHEVGVHTFTHGNLANVSRGEHAWNSTRLSSPSRRRPGTRRACCGRPIPPGRRRHLLGVAGLGGQGTTGPSIPTWTPRTGRGPASTPSSEPDCRRTARVQSS